jgi:hypothetical protein
MKQAEAAFDAASDRFDDAERALDAAREERAQPRRDRYTARQAYEQASVAADQLARRMRDLAERLDRPAELGASWAGRAPDLAEGGGIAGGLLAQCCDAQRPQLLQMLASFLSAPW